MGIQGRKKEEEGVNMVYWKYEIYGATEYTDDLKETIIKFADGVLEDDYKDWLAMEINPDTIMGDFIREDGDLVSKYEELKEEFAKDMVNSEDEDGLVYVGSLTFSRRCGDVPEPDIDDE